MPDLHVEVTSGNQYGPITGEEFVKIINQITDQITIKFNRQQKQIDKLTADLNTERRLRLGGGGSRRG